MWQEYFPHVGKIVGLDIDPECEQYRRAPLIDIYIGSQADTSLLEKIAAEAGPFDIIIDDGSHINGHQIETFKALFPSLSEGGVYVIEDTHTSYWSEFGGAKNRGYTALGMIKHLIDEMHYWAIQNPRRNIVTKIQHRVFKKEKPVPANIFQSNIRAMYIADSICFIHKQQIEKDKIAKY